MTQKRLKSGRLLDSNGVLTEAGYATSLVKDYSRDDIKAPRLRIKEWDYYFIGNDHYGVAMTIADNSYMGFVGCTFFDFDNKNYKTKNFMTFMPKGKTNMPSTSKAGDVFFKNKKIDIQFFNDGSKRHLLCQIPKFDKNKEILVDVLLTDEPEDSMVIATPFGKGKYEKYFYYNQKINCLRASGTVKYDDKEYVFNPEDSFAVLDWGRGVWPYKNTWYWSSMSGLHEGVRVGFNLGYGFGDTSNASENMIFYDGKAYKLDQVKFNIPIKNGKEDYLSTWTIESNDDKLNLTFEPIIDRHSSDNVLIISSAQHQVFGCFSGTLRVEDKTLEIKNLLGFAEKVSNRW